MVPVQRALEGLSQFIANDVIATMPNGLNKFLALMALGAMKANPSSLLKTYEPTLKSIGILSSDGSMVDTALLRSSFDEVFSQMPSFSAFGFSFTSEDGNRLIQRMEG